MKAVVLAVFAFANGAAAGAATALSRARAWAAGAKSEPVVGISARRVRALAALSSFVPSTIGDAKFSKMAPGYKRAVGPDGHVVSTIYGKALPSGFTGCGFAPCAMVRIGLGDPTGFTQCGLEQARINAKKQDAWVDAGGDARPRPGDILLYVNSVNVPVHVGVFVGYNPDGTWHTADAGQTEGHDSPIEHAKYLDRVYDPEKITLGGHRLAGWVDLDRVKVHDVASVSGQVVDVRSETEFLSGHIDGAVNWPIDGEGGASLDKGRPVFVYCKTGWRSRRAAHHLASMGFDVTDMGGWSPW